MRRAADVALVVAVVSVLACAAVSYSAQPRPAACAVVDLGDVVVCADRVLGVEPDGFGGAVIATALDGVRLDYATEHSLETVARRMRSVR